MELQKWNLELRDFIVTPLVIILVLGVAYVLRQRFTDEVTRQYYLPALLLKIFGALGVGFLYQFYYPKGDTYNFHTNGSRIIWEAFLDSPVTGLKLLTANGEYTQGIYSYASRITFFRDPSSYFVIRVSSLFDLLTFSTYSATAVLFAVLSFGGAWAMFITFYRRSPELHRWLALATLFIPSVVFWGSGLLKDTLTIAAVGFLTFVVNKLFVERRVSLGHFILLLLCVWTIYSVKKYILLCYLPAAFFWVYAERLARIRSVVLRILVVPFIVALMLASGYFAIVVVGRDDPRYAIDQIAVTAQVTAYDIYYVSGSESGSRYNLGELDGTFGSMITKAPQAVNVSLFRPYLWEIRNPLMVLSAFESLALAILTLYVVVRARSRLMGTLGNPTVLFCLIFSITFAFAVGISTFNFGTLARYKIPLMPFYLLAMVYILYYSNKARKLAVLDATE